MGKTSKLIKKEMLSEMATLTKIVVPKLAPNIGVEKLYIYDIATDTKDTYTATKIYEIQDSTVQATYAPNETPSEDFADNKKTWVDYTSSPSGTLVTSGISTELLVSMLGYESDGKGSYKESTKNRPNCGCFYLIQTKNGYFIRQIFNFTASQDSETYDSKQTNTTYGHVTYNISPVSSVFFDGYSRLIDCQDEVFAGKKAVEILEELALDPSKSWTTTVGV